MFGLVFHWSVSEELVWFGWYTLKVFKDSKLQTAIFVKRQDKKKWHKADLDYISEEITVLSLEKIIFLMYFGTNLNLDLKKSIKLQKKKRLQYETALICSLCSELFCLLAENENFMLQATLFSFLLCLSIHVIFSGLGDAEVDW